MKKKYTFILLCILINTAVAQTTISGFINANTTWNLSGSPYIVVGNALLSHGYTLTIDPGVIVKFDPATALQIDGELHAIGTAANRIIFTSNQAVPAAGDWGQIHFSDTCVDAVFDPQENYITGCIMKYCDVLYGGGAGYGAIHNGTSYPYFSHCNILNSAAKGIYAHEAFRIDSSSIKYCSDYAIYFLDPFYNFPVISITNDSIVYNGGGISMTTGSPGNPTITITNNWFLHNSSPTNRIIDCPSLSTVRNIMIRENEFSDNSMLGILQLGSMQDGTIECNRFMNNDLTVIFASACIVFQNNGGYAKVQNNIFEGNISSTSPTVADFSSGVNNLFFRNNIIRNNNSAGSICKFVIAADSIDHNQFENNTGVSAINTVAANNNGYLKFNNFSDPNCQYEIYNSIPYTALDIHVDSNYWGSINTQHVDSVIYDYFDDLNKSIVYYMPILESPVPIDTTCPSISMGIQPLSNGESHFLIYPNPAHDNFTITFNEQLKNAEMKIFDVMGRVVHEQKINSELSTFNFQLSAGVYFVKVEAREKVYAQKLVVE